MKKFTLIALLLTLFSSLLPGATFAHSNNDVNVERVAFPVTLADNQNYTMVGYLYTRHGNPNNVSQCGKRSDTIQVALHGASYNHKYWDPGVDGIINGVDYSYARYMARQCYTVLALDRLGHGESSRPADPEFAGVATEADALAQVLTALRTNHNPIHKKYKRIVLVGHSFGSFLSVYTLGEYGHVADGLVATGWAHAPALVPLPPDLVPALSLPGYNFLDAQLRDQLIFYPPFADPAVVADSHTVSEPIASAYWRDGVAVFNARSAGDVALIKQVSKVDQVTAPIFAQMADFDVLFPATLLAGEAAFYSNAPSVTTNVALNVGHGFNLHTTAPQSWPPINSWISATIVN